MNGLNGANYVKRFGAAQSRGFVFKSYALRQVGSLHYRDGKRWLEEGAAVDLRAGLMVRASRVKLKPEALRFVTMIARDIANLPMPKLVKREPTTNQWLVGGDPADEGDCG